MKRLEAYESLATNILSDAEFVPTFKEVVSPKVVNFLEKHPESEEAKLFVDGLKWGTMATLIIIMEGKIDLQMLKLKKE